MASGFSPSIEMSMTNGLLGLSADAADPDTAAQANTKRNRIRRQSGHIKLSVMTHAVAESGSQSPSILVLLAAKWRWPLSVR